MITSYEEWDAYFDEFAELYMLCFNQPMDKEEVIWRYFKSPYNDVVACFVIDEGKLVANYSVSPSYLYKNGQVIKAAQSLNTMTHPNYMGKGLFVEAASRVYSYLAEHGYNLVWGFPNYISNRTFITKLDWNDIMVVPTLEITLDRVQHFVSENVIEDNQLCLDYTSCLKNNEEIQVYKTNEFLRWRYSLHPHINYKIFAYSEDEKNATSRIICKEYKNILNIVDYTINNQNELEELIKHTLSYAKMMNKESLTMWSKLGDEMHIMMERYGAKNITPVTYFGCVCFDKALEEEFSISKNWMIHMSDDNVY